MFIDIPGFFVTMIPLYLIGGILLVALLNGTAKRTIIELATMWLKMSVIIALMLTPALMLILELLTVEGTK